MRIVLTGGGSGGHVFPNFAILPLLLRRAEVFYIGEKGKLEEKLSAENNLPFYPLTAPKLVRGKFICNLSIPQKLVKSVSEAKRALKGISPSVVFSKGGYVALPVSIAANSLGIPLVFHESDISMGLANKLCLPFASKVLTSFNYDNPKYITTCSPVREEILLAKREKLFDNAFPNLLILGGSLGASELNDFAFENKDALAEKFNVILVTGKDKNRYGKKADNSLGKKENNLSKTSTSRRGGFFVTEFAENVGRLFASADVCISRGGSGALFELALKKLPSLIVPLKCASRGEQVKNAEYFERAGIFAVHKEGANILDEVEAVYKNRARYKENMKNSPFSDGKERIVEEIFASVKIDD